MSLFAEVALLPGGWAKDVRIEFAPGGTIACVTVGAPALPSDRRCGAVLPGMPNLHSHAFQRSLAGRAERRTSADDDFWSWRERMYALACELDPDGLYTIALDAYRTMLGAGYTSVAEFHYIHRDPAGRFYAERALMAQALVAAARDAGIAIALLPALYAHGDIGGAPLDERRKRFATSVDEVLEIARTVRSAYAHDPDVVVGVCAHSLRAVTPEELTALVAGSPRDVPIHIHVAEQLREVEAVERVLGARPVAWLLAHADIDARWCLVHATHLDTHERRALARSGAIAGLCPTTEANLGDGVFPLGEHLDGGGAFGIGSDSNVSIDVVEELRWLEYGQRLKTMRRQVAAREIGVSCGEALYSGAVAGGALAVGRNTGKIAAGFRADLIVLTCDRDESFLLDRYVFESGYARPHEIMVSGQWLKFS
jgi:formimidoylglutamate deiminase